jgi:hypothetical protein
MKRIQKNCWKLLPCLPDSLGLGPFDYHLFQFIKDQMQGQHYATNEAAQEAIWHCSRTDETKFYHKMIFKLLEW